VLAGVLALSAGACGGSSSKHAAQAGTTTDGQTSSTTSSTATTPTGKKKRPSLSATPAKTLSFSGTGVKEIGKPAALRIPTDSTLKWTNDGALFQIIPASIHVQSPVNSREHSGEAKLRKGAYHGFLVNAIGHWTLTIVPGG
jgi:hypothetical protein